MSKKPKKNKFLDVKSDNCPEHILLSFYFYYLHKEFTKLLKSKQSSSFSIFDLQLNLSMWFNTNLTIKSLKDAFLGNLFAI